MLARRKGHASPAHPLETVPAPSVRQRDAAGDIHAVDLDMKCAAGKVEARRGAKLDVIVARSGDIHGIGEPLAGFEVVHHETAALAVG